MNRIAPLILNLMYCIADRINILRGAAAPLLMLTYLRVEAMNRRLNRLWDKWRSNTLPKPRQPRPGRVSKPNPNRPKFPAMRGWVFNHVGGRTVEHATCLDRFLQTDPDFARFLAEVPQAGRILRPLCHMLAIDPPAAIKRSPAPRKPRPKKPKPPAPPSRPQLRYPIGEIPTRLRLRVPKLRRRRSPP